MSRHVRLCFALVVLAGMSSYAAAQGRAGGAGHAPAGATHGSALGGQRPILSPESRRQDAAKKEDAQRRRAEGEAHNRSDAARAEHAPNEHAADEAFAGAQNAENKDERTERAARKGENRGDHGSGKKP